jgi:hypothetical protein
MAELADAADSKSAEGNLVGVRPPLPAPNKLPYNQQPIANGFVCAQDVPKSAGPWSAVAECWHPLRVGMIQSSTRASDDRRVQTC